MKGMNANDDFRVASPKEAVPLDDLPSCRHRMRVHGTLPSVVRPESIIKGRINWAQSSTPFVGAARGLCSRMMAMRLIESSSRGPWAAARGTLGGRGGGGGGRKAALSAIYLARPKSASLTVPSVVRRTFDGLRSR